MPCICKHKLAQVAGLSASLSASLQVVAALPVPPIHASLHVLAGLPAGAGPYSDSLILSVQELHLPKIALVAGLPTLSGLVNVAVMCQQLSLPLPLASLKLSAMLGTMNLAPLAPLLKLDLPLLLKLQLYAQVMLQLKALKIDPLAIDLVAAQLAVAAAGIHVAVNIPMPQIPNLVVKLGEIAAIHPLISLALTLGINLGSPHGLAQLSATIKALLQLTLPPVAIPLELLARIAAVAQIHAAFGPITPAALSIQLRALLALRLPLPAINAQLGMKLPTPAQVTDVLALNLPQLAAIKWSIPSTLPLLGLLPAISAAVQLNALGVLSPGICGAGCPMEAAAQLI